jgi:VCBS repeat protein
VKEFATSTQPLTLVTGDFNGDGKADAIVGSSSPIADNFISVFLGDGAGNLAAPINIPSAETSFLSSGDFNGDGKPDLIKSKSQGPIGILLNDGTGHFAPPREFDFGRSSSFRVDATAGDFNEDGKLDVVTNAITLAFGDGAGGLLAAPSLRAGKEPSSAATGDFNEDGRQDLLVANYSSSNVSLLIQNETGGYEPATNFPVDLLPSFIAVADFNGDDHLDFVTANNRVNLGDNKILGTVSIGLGDGVGHFAPAKLPLRPRPEFARCSRR